MGPPDPEHWLKTMSFCMSLITQVAISALKNIFIISS